MKAIELMKKTNFEDVCEAAKKYELTPTPKERYREIYDRILVVQPGDSVNFLIVAPFEYPAEGAIETAPDVRIMTPGSRLRCIAKTPLRSKKLRGYDCIRRVIGYITSACRVVNLTGALKYGIDLGTLNCCVCLGTLKVWDTKTEGYLWTIMCIFSAARIYRRINTGSINYFVFKIYNPVYLLLGYSFFSSVNPAR